MIITNEQRLRAWVKFAAAALHNPSIADDRRWEQDSIVERCCEYADKLLEGMEQTFSGEDDE